MRRAILFLTAMVVAMALGAGIALAVSGNFTGTNAGETITGSDGRDRLDGGGGGDTVNGKGDNDQLFAAFGTDTLNGGGGDDYLNADDNKGGDTLNGGNGDDTCDGDPGEDTFISCEHIE